jgi:hypothetical protein
MHVMACIPLYARDIAKVVSSNLVHGEEYSILHHVITFVSYLQQVGGFLRVFRFPPPLKLTATITEILLKVTLNTINQAKPNYGRLSDPSISLTHKTVIRDLFEVLLKGKFNQLILRRP